MSPAKLALEDGTIYQGRSFGSDRETVGEVVFNTAMTGYQEILTDPSYCGQIVAMTYPEIGNYGVNAIDIENDSPSLSGFVVRHLSRVHSSYRADGSLTDYLKQHDIPGICDVAHSVWCGTFAPPVQCVVCCRPPIWTMRRWWPKRNQPRRWLAGTWSAK